MWEALLVSSTFFFINKTVYFIFYQYFKKTSTGPVKFLSLNFVKDFLWVGVFMYYYNEYYPLSIFVFITFLLGSISLYTIVIKELNQQN